MKVRAIIVMFVAIAFVTGMLSVCFAQTVSGTVTKIDGSKVTLKGADGKETTVDVKNATSVKVGDSVNITNGTASVKNTTGKVTTSKVKKCTGQPDCKCDKCCKKQ